MEDDDNFFFVDGDGSGGCVVMLLEKYYVNQLIIFCTPDRCPLYFACFCLRLLLQSRTNARMLFMGSLSMLSNRWAVPLLGVSFTP